MHGSLGDRYAHWRALGNCCEEYSLFMLMYVHYVYDMTFDDIEIGQLFRIFFNSYNT